jgi:hypothetical protein
VVKAVPMAALARACWVETKEADTADEQQQPKVPAKRPQGPRMRAVSSQQQGTPGPSAKHKRLARTVAPVPSLYEIIDDRIQPDALGSLGGQRIFEQSGKRFCV